VDAGEGPSSTKRQRGNNTSSNGELTFRSRLKCVLIISFVFRKFNFPGDAIL
jgi:hypothetical protein